MGFAGVAASAGAIARGHGFSVPQPLAFVCHTSDTRCMTSATDALARARAELYAAEQMGSPEVDVAQAAVEQAEQAVVDEQGWCPVCGDLCGWECPS